MKIQTKDFGIAEINPDEVIQFPKGLFAFEEFTRFALIRQEESPALWLQSIEGADPRFVLFNPEEIIDGYNPDLPEGVFREMKACHDEALNLFVIAVIPEHITDMTINLKSPIVINFEKKLGMQIILENEDYPVRQRLFKGGERGAL